MADVTVTAAEVLPASDSLYANGVFKSTTTAGQTAYLSKTDGTDPPTYGLFDANGTDEAATLAGVFMNGGAAGQACRVLVGGSYDPGFTATVGEIYVGTATPGGIALADDLASGWKTAILGIATSASNISYIGHSSLVALTA